MGKCPTIGGASDSPEVVFRLVMYKITLSYSQEPELMKRGSGGLNHRSSFLLQSRAGEGASEDRQ